MEISDEVVRLYLNNNHHSGSAIWTKMIRNGYRFNLEGWSLSRVVMVVFGSGSTVGATFDLNFRTGKLLHEKIRSRLASCVAPSRLLIDYDDVLVPCLTPTYPCLYVPVGVVHVVYVPENRRADLHYSK
eukprot:scaffold28410_cov51-Attheya_sp.AAC.3